MPIVVNVIDFYGVQTIQAAQAAQAAQLPPPIALAHEPQPVTGISSRFDPTK